MCHQKRNEGTKALLRLGIRKHLFVKSCVRENIEKHTCFYFRIIKRTADDFVNHAEGEKPGREQHKERKHLQNQRSRTRGVDNIKTVARAEGAKKQTKMNGTQGEDVVFELCNTPNVRMAKQQECQVFLEKGV